MATVWRTPCAFARLFLVKPGQILNNATDLGSHVAPTSKSVIWSSRTYSNYAKSPYISKITEQYEFEVVKKPPEWAYVERLLPFETIPQVVLKDNYPSGWKPPNEESKNLTYFIPRNKNHQLPIYLNLTFRGSRKITMIRKIEGDIWALNEEIKDYLKHKNKMYVETRVHEPGRFIETKGDFYNDVFDWAHSKGF